jgi:hypothetical protein
MRDLNINELCTIISGVKILHFACRKMAGQWNGAESTIISGVKILHFACRKMAGQWNGAARSSNIHSRFTFLRPLQLHPPQSGSSCTYTITIIHRKHNTPGARSYSSATPSPQANIRGALLLQG